jgi:hypothetical protein
MASAYRILTIKATILDWKYEILGLDLSINHKAQKIM